MKKMLALLLALIMVFSLVACGAKEETPVEEAPKTEVETPATEETPVEAPAEVPESWLCDEKTTLKVLTYDAVNSGFPAPSNDLRFWQWLEEYTNVHIEWEVVSYTGYTDILSARIAGGDNLADIIMLYNQSIGNDAGKNGLVVDLSQYWDTCFTNTQAYYDAQNTPYKTAITNGDGTCYGITSFANPIENHIVFCYNTEWMEKLGAEIPETLDEFTALLQQMKDAGDLNGNGLDDEVILTAADIDHVRSMINNAFNLEQYQSEAIFSVDDSGVVHPMYVSDEMKQSLTYLNGLYEEGLMDPEICTMSYDALSEKVAADRVGVFACYSGYAVTYGNLTSAAQDAPYEEYYTLGYPLASEYNNNTPFFTKNESYTADMTGISADCENVELAAKWLDTLYADPTVLDVRGLGWEGETYTRDENGNPHPILPEDGSSWDITQYGCGQIALAHTQTTQELVISDEASPWYVEQYSYLRDNFEWRTHSIVKVAGYTDEEKDLRMFYSDVKTGWAEHRDKFIKGELDIEEDWDEFVSTMEALGMNDVCQAYQSIYDRTK